MSNISNFMEERRTLEILQ